MKKVAVITGGFGSIGYSIVKTLDQAGYAIVILSRNAESEDNKQKLSSLSTDQVLAINCDISDSTNVNAARDRVLKEYGSIDVLINCAGWMKPVAHSDLDALTDEIFDKIVTYNLRSVFTVVRAFSPWCKDESVIVNIGSAAGYRRGGSSIAYAAAKAGVDSLTRNLSVTLAPKTRVVGVSPGFVGTPNNSDTNMRIAAAATPMGRVATVDDVAHMVISVINNKFLNGSTVILDGGRSV
jgi:3-oxoacyl-[acyl-carrier protein] reductase